MTIEHPRMSPLVAGAAPDMRLALNTLDQSLRGLEPVARRVEHALGQSDLNEFDRAEVEGFAKTLADVAGRAALVADRLLAKLERAP